MPEQTAPRVVAFWLAFAATIGVALPARLAAADPSSGCGHSGIETGRRLERTIDVDGASRNYILDVPPGVGAGSPVPLLFDFHGFGHSGAGVWRVSEFKGISLREPFMTVYPEGEPVVLGGREAAGWQIFEIEGNRDLALVRRLLGDLEQRYCIDRSRVYATGFSNGAYFSQLLACVMADRFAAVAPVGSGPVAVPCEPERGVPVIFHHGRSDEIVPVAAARRARDRWIEIDRCHEHGSNGCERHASCRDGAEVQYCEGDFGHHWPPGATDRIWKFLRRHALEKMFIEPHLPSKDGQ